MQPYPAFSCSDWLKNITSVLHVRPKREVGAVSAVVLTEPVWHTTLPYFWAINVKAHNLIFGCVSFFLAFRDPLSSRLWGHVAGSRSVSEFCERGEVTSGFLCGDGQVLWCYCEGRKTSSMNALLVNVWNLIFWARAPVGGNMPLSPAIMPHSLSLLPPPLYSLCLSVHATWHFMQREHKLYIGS